MEEGTKRGKLTWYGRLCSLQKVQELKVLILNSPFLGKWYWRFANDKDGLWRKVVEDCFEVTERWW